MVQLNYDEFRLLRELKNSERRIAGTNLDGLELLVKEGYATTFHPNFSETLYSITTKGWAALHAPTLHTLLELNACTDCWQAIGDG
jgi:hypothetical protein